MPTMVHSCASAVANIFPLLRLILNFLRTLVVVLQCVDVIRRMHSKEYALQQGEKLVFQNGMKIFVNSAFEQFSYNLYADGSLC